MEVDLYSRYEIVQSRGLVLFKSPNGRKKFETLSPKTQV
jgi:hypothetical protein